MRKVEWWLLDTRWGCGGIVSVNGIVTNAAPIFRRFQGYTVKKLKAMYQVQAVFSPEIENQEQSLEKLPPALPEASRTGEELGKGKGEK